MRKVKLNLVCIVTLILLFSCKMNKVKMLNIGDQIQEKELLDTSFRMIKAGSIQVVYTILIDDITFNISKGEENIITYLETKDAKFETPEGVKVGMPLSDVIEKCNTKLRLERGWAYTIELPSNWNAAFRLSEKNPKEMSLDRTVNWLYKRE